jgi:hypothetical protein
MESQETEEKNEIFKTNLGDAFPELADAKNLVEMALTLPEKNSMVIETLGAIMGFAQAKLYHYAEKYGFEVEDGDVFYFGHVGRHLRFEGGGNGKGTGTAGRE